ncbi:MAG: hypothetical protein QG626_80 [Patescibacteria group bacterium]|jgi:hypothetical protein|nr:hypothetical protein [Patescibacteria group bacterium]
MATAAQIRALLAQRSVAQEHAIVTADGAMLDYVDEVQVNWRDALRILDDALMSVVHEGQFQSTKVREALSLIDTILEALAESAGLAERRLDRIHIAWFDRLLVYLPGVAGNRARLIFSAYQRDGAELVRLNGLIETVRGYRKEIAVAIDKAIDAHLLSESDKYQLLRTVADRYIAEKGRARELSASLDFAPSGQQIEVAVDFYDERSISPKLPPLPMGAYKFQHNVEALRGGLSHYATEQDSCANVALAQMGAMRGQLKAKIYGSSDK